MVIVATTDKVFCLGWQYENAARTVQFDVAGILAEHPSADFLVLNKRYGDEAAYPVPQNHLTLDGGKLLWTLTSGDLANPGYGECELVASEDSVVVKTAIYSTYVERALGTEETVPDPWQGWVDEVTDAADAAESARDAAIEAKDAAEQAASLLEAVSVEAETLTPGSQATGSYDEGTFRFGIPRGDKGETGATPDLSVGTVTTGAPGTDASVTITGTAEDPVLNMTIPRGDPGMESVLVGTQLSGNQYRLGIERV